MSPAFTSGVEKHFPEAHLTFDKFHVLKIINEAVDEVRREEQQSHPELKRTRYLWLKNPGNLKEHQVATLAALQVKNMNLKTARAYHIRGVPGLPVLSSCLRLWSSASSAGPGRNYHNSS